MKKKCKPKRELGGIAETMQSLSPLLSLIPGIGPIGSGIASAGLGLLSSLADKPSAYQPIGPNTSKYGYAMGGPLTTLTKDEEPIFQQWKQSLPTNLQTDNNLYDLRGAWKGGLEPELVEGEWHLGSRNPETGQLLKSPQHPTYDKMIQGEIEAGYTPSIDMKTGKMKSFAMGGQLQPLSQGTMQVQANNPQQTDSVDVGSAMVDHGETITNNYVFSDVLKNPLTGRTFAKENAIIAKKEKKIEEKYNDPYAENAAKWNQKSREEIMKLNELMKLGQQLKGSGMKNGRYMKPGLVEGGPTDPIYASSGYGAGPVGTFQKGYSAPWDTFNVASFQKWAGVKGKAWDNVYGDATHKLFQERGDEYAKQMGYGKDPQGMYLPQTFLNQQTQNSLDAYQFGDFDRNRGREVDPIASGSEYRMMKADDASKRNMSGIPNVASLNQNIRPASLEAVMNPKAATPEEEALREKMSTGEALQLGELFAKAGMLAIGKDRQPLYQNAAPVTLRGFDPSNQLQRSELTYNKARADMQSASSGLGTLLGNMQGAATNKYAADQGILSQYANMNREAQVGYEQRLGQRAGENIQRKYATDQMRQQDEGAYQKGIYDLLTSVGNYGKAKVSQDENKKSVQWMLQSFPDIAKYFNLG